VFRETTLRFVAFDASPQHYLQKSEHNHFPHHTTKMPHSETPEEDAVPMETVPQAQDNGGETQMTEGTLMAESEGQNGDSQATDSPELDMTMADIGIESAVQDVQIKEDTKLDIKLEDLFADMDSDDEFPSSAAPDVKISSSPEAPESPM
jgi:DNA primase small subunit